MSFTTTVRIVKMRPRLTIAALIGIVCLFVLPADLPRAVRALPAPGSLCSTA